MAKKRQTPRPPRPVQGPKRRDGTRPKPAALLGRPVWIWAAGGIGLVAVAGVLAYTLSTGGGTAPLPLTPASSLGSLRAAPAPGPIGPEGVPIPAAPPLAPAGWLTLGQSRDGINCQPIEQLAYHIHVHLTVFIDGKARLIPYGIGIAPPRLGTNTQNRSEEHTSELQS